VCVSAFGDGLRESGVGVAVEVHMFESVTGGNEVGEMVVSEEVVVDAVVFAGPWGSGGGGGNECGVGEVG